jgi:hypothetical protein
VSTAGFDQPKMELGESLGCAKQDWGIKMEMLGRRKLGDKRCRMNVGGPGGCLRTWQACDDFGGSLRWVRDAVDLGPSI